ncbi:PTS sugar transporter subunit IIA [Halobellus limi]|jgi:PTS system fructose-specific IIA component|uniref:PTS sugar transporter subunit IIA n=1 Tax=Halobellus limi TaxID=699433 RepID=A0A1H5ULV1_9EURY|nr:fructose PTS transporter subunit IIA [Halobellus limi]QCC46991.1 PTS sugar transporter subunit IIA [Halobellus limi]SEF76032.1 PTS system, fructose-specific IIA component [Halobellus limi]
MLEDDIDRLLPLAHISLSEPPANKTDAIEFLLGLIADNGRVTDREAALDALREREKEATTGVGMGIGIPHAKTSAVEEPSIAFARSGEGIDFDAMDDEPARLLFMILVPEEGGEEHLQILSALSRALMHEDVRETLLEAEDEETVQETVREAVN